MINRELAYKAYRKVHRFDEKAVFSIDPRVFEFLEEYQLLDALDNFHNTKPTFMPFKSDMPPKKAKEIALEAAVQLSGRLPTQITFGEGKKERSPVVALAQEIYEWLTEPKTDKR